MSEQEVFIPTTCPLCDGKLRKYLQPDGVPVYICGCGEVVMARDGLQAMDELTALRKRVEELERNVSRLTTERDEARKVLASIDLYAYRGRVYHAPDGDEPCDAAREGFDRIEQAVRKALTRHSEKK